MCNGKKWRKREKQEEGQEKVQNPSRQRGDPCFINKLLLARISFCLKSIFSILQGNIISLASPDPLVIDIEGLQQ